MLKKYIYILFILLIQNSLFAISCNNEECSGTCYYYYYDLDNDDKLGRIYGHLCVTDGSEDSQQVEYISTEFVELQGETVHTAHCSRTDEGDCASSRFDNDDDCNGNTYDDCGICTSTGSPISSYNGGIYESNCESSSNNFNPPSSCSQNVTFTLTGIVETIAMDCAGTCNNFQSPDVSSEYGSTMQTFYQDSDSDGLGDPASTVTRCSNDGPPSGYVANSNDPEPSCSTNDTDCNGVCGGSAYTDPNYGSDNCTSNQCVGGSTGNAACVQDCSGAWGGTKTNYYYYYDLDNDGSPGRVYGFICAVAGTESSQQVSYIGSEFSALSGVNVHTYTCGENPCNGFGGEAFDTDDDCSGNTYDDCGVCTSTGSPIATYGGGISESSCESSANNFNPPASCSQSVTYSNGVSETVAMDCAGTCSNYQSVDVSSPYGSTMQTFYQDSDGDGLGDPSSTVTRCSNDGPPSGYVANSNDTEPSCRTNDTDCNGTCGGSAYIDPRYGDDDCTVNECVAGTTGEVACTPDCDGDWGGTKTNYFYYYDLDNDGFPGRAYGYLCLASGTENSHQILYSNAEYPLLSGQSVHTVTCGASACSGSGVEAFDTDDDCKCSSNSNCHDDCGVCTSTGSPIATYGGGISESSCESSANNFNPPASCSQSVTYSNGVSETVAMDCAGTCSNYQSVDVSSPYGSTMQTFYQDSDGDGLGDPSSTVTRCSNDGPPSGYVANNNDTEPNCSTNDTDCNGVCGGSAYTDPHFGDDDCTINSCVGGTTGNIACTLDCNGDWGGTNTNYFYYYDLDNDGFPGRVYGHLCLTAGTENSKQVVYAGTEYSQLSGNVHTVTCGAGACSGNGAEAFDTDDDCKCASNSNCYDDCGICKSTGSSIASYGGGIYESNCESSANNFNPPASCSQSVTYTLTGITENVVMDCAGTCSNFQLDDVSSPYGSTMQTFYQDSDGDGLGDPSSTVTRCSNDGPPSGYVANNNDTEPNCVTNDTDCNGDCAGSAYFDPHFGDDDCRANNSHPECVGGNTGYSACIQDCEGKWGGNATNYYYYYDLDNDELLGRQYGNICVNNGSEDSQQVQYIGWRVSIQGESVHTAHCSRTIENDCPEFDSDDDCKNNEYDDCGICKSTGINGADYNGGIERADCISNYDINDSDCFNDGTGLSENVIMDCGGNCSNGFGGGTYGDVLENMYPDIDNDGLGDSNSNSENICNSTPNYATNNLDLDDNCASNIHDCYDQDGDGLGVCDGTASIDVCGVCTGGTTGKEVGNNYYYYHDRDGDGVPGRIYGYLCTSSEAFADSVVGKATCYNDACLNDGTPGQQNDIDDYCYCTENFDCYDHCNICKLADATTLLGTIDSTICTAGTFPHPESCIDKTILAVVGSTVVYDTLAMMDCAGTCSNFQMDDIDYPFGSTMIDRWIDVDGDGLGANIDSVKACSINSDYVDNNSDINDNIFCKENIIDCAEVCLGSSYLDCGGICDADSTNDDTYRTFYFDNDGDGLAGSNSLVACSAEEYVTYNDSTILLTDLFETSNDVDDKLFCSTNVIDECGFCEGYDLVDSEGNCAFIVFPGDVDNNGTVSLSDIDFIVNYWGQQIKPRSSIENIAGQTVKSTYTFSPAQYHLIDNIANKDRCLLRADANGDGRISMQDINAVLINLNSSHPYPDEVSFCSEDLVLRESNIEIYLQIYNTLPPGELKNAIAKEFGFEVVPYEFIVDSNYPNPFNPITTIYYEIPEEGKLEIDFINLVGQVIESSALFHVPGHYEYIWDASAYPSGIYFYNMKFNGVSKSYHKMMLIK